MWPTGWQQGETAEENERKQYKGHSHRTPQNTTAAWQPSTTLLHYDGKVTFNHLKLLVCSKWRFYKQMGLLNKTGRSCSAERELCRCSHADWMKCAAHWLINHAVLIQLLVFSGKCCTGSFFNTDFRFVCQGSERTKYITLWEKCVRFFEHKRISRYNRVFPSSASRWTSSWAFTDCFMRQCVINESFPREREIKLSPTGNPNDRKHFRWVSSVLDASIARRL